MDTPLNDEFGGVYIWSFCLLASIDTHYCVVY